MNVVLNNLNQFDSSTAKWGEKKLEFTTEKRLQDILVVNRADATSVHYSTSQMFDIHVYNYNIIYTINICLASVKLPLLHQCIEGKCIEENI